MVRKALYQINELELDITSQTSVSSRVLTLLENMVHGSKTTVCFYRVGGGFNPTPNGALVAPRRIMPGMNGRPSHRNLPGLHVSKAPAMGPGMPPPPPSYSQEQSFHAQTPGRSSGIRKSLIIMDIQTILNNTF